MGDVEASRAPDENRLVAQALSSYSFFQAFASQMVGMLRGPSPAHCGHSFAKTHLAATWIDEVGRLVWRLSAYQSHPFRVHGERRFDEFVAWDEHLEMLPESAALYLNACVYPTSYLAISDFEYQ